MSKKGVDRRGKNQVGENNPNWRGTKAFLPAIHKWIKTRKPKPIFCEECKKRKARDLANLSYEYKRDINDYKWLCRSCHFKMDVGNNPKWKKHLNSLNDKKTKKAKKTVTYWKKKAWNEFSKFIRTRDTCRLGTECYTCGKYYDIKRMQAGHFQPGRYPIFLFDERQVHAQCFRCNINLKGNWPEYYKRMVKDFGRSEVEEMVNQKNNFKQWKSYELEEIYNKYKALNKLNE